MLALSGVRGWIELASSAGRFEKTYLSPLGTRSSRAESSERNLKLPPPPKSRSCLTGPLAEHLLLKTTFISFSTPKHPSLVAIPCTVSDISCFHTPTHTHASPRRALALRADLVYMPSHNLSVPFPFSRLKTSSTLNNVSARDTVQIHHSAGHPAVTYER